MAREVSQGSAGADLDKVWDATRSVLQYSGGGSGERTWSSTSGTSLEKRSSLLSAPDFDDSEFDVPVVTLPTLEDILADESQGIDPFDADAFGGSIPDPGPVVPKKLKQNVQSNVHGSVLRPSRLKNLAAQLHTASAKVEAGLPTAVAVSAMIAIGTSHGLVLLFDPNQALKLVLGNARQGQQYGPVSALDFNADMSRLIVGHAKGQLTVWDLGSGKCIRTITDAHMPGTTILHVYYLDDLTQAVFSDSGGSVFLLQFRRVMGVRTADSDCLFSGSRGEVCCIQPLLCRGDFVRHPLGELRILALASLTKVIVVALRPKLEVLHTFPLRGELGTLPLLHWQFMPTSGEKSSYEAILAASRGDQLIFHRLVVENSERRASVEFIKQWTLPYQAINVKFLFEQVMVIMDTREHAHVVDTRDLVELENVDLADVQLAYSTSHFKSLAAGGAVSKALEVASQHSCYQSVVMFNGQLLLLGIESVHVLTLRKWDERIAVLSRDSLYPEALSLAITFYRGTARAVVGLTGSKEERRAAVSEEMIGLLQAYVGISLDVNIPPANKVAEQEEFFRSLINICIDYCLLLGETDLLFGELYERFADLVVGRACFLECLEPYIVSDQLTSLSPVVLKDFIEHYQTHEMLQRVEACLVHLEVQNLDLHQVVVLCWTYGLYDAMIYVYTRGMNDYSTPLQELLRLLRASISGGTTPLPEADQRLGYKLLVYISCCLAGRAYPTGQIREALVEPVRVAIFSILIKKQLDDPSPNEPVETYPHLRTLLRFDTREFLNVLAFAFEEDYFTTVPLKDPSTGEAILKPGRQLVVDLLLKVMMTSKHFTPAQLGSLFTFLARQMAKHKDIKVNKQLFEQVLEYLCSPDESIRHEERQQAMLELLGTNIVNQFGDDHLIVLCENARFYQVLEQLYERRREFAKVLSCYWRDPARSSQAFSYIHHVMLDDSFVEFERMDVEKAALDHLKELMEANSLATAKLIVTDFAHDLNDVIKRLTAFPKLEYEFLENVFGGPGGVPLTKPESPPPPEVHERYIELICLNHPQTVYSYVRSNENYRLEETLAICRKYRISDATAFLLERTGDVKGAFTLMIDMLTKSLSSLNDTISSCISNRHSVIENDKFRMALSGVRTTLLVIIQLCQRNSARLELEQRAELWFPLLDSAMGPQQRWRTEDPSLVSKLKELTSDVLNSMMGYVPLSSTLQRILNDPTTSGGAFGELKDLIMGMVDTYTYEQTLLTTTNRLLAGDINHAISTHCKVVERGLAPRGAFCSNCGRRLWRAPGPSATGRSSNSSAVQGSASQAEDIYVFSCGHSYHRVCVLTRQQGTEACGICNKKRSSAPHNWHQIRSPRAADTRQDIALATGGNSTKSTVDLKPEAQVQRVEVVAQLHSSFRSASRHKVLQSLSARSHSNPHNLSTAVGAQSVEDKFQLRLAPPRL